MSIPKHFLRSLVLFSALHACQSPKAESSSTEIAITEDNKAAKPLTFSQWFANPVPIVSAHRGGPYPGFPENTLETFENIASQTLTIIECDIAMTSDSVLVLMHDQTIDRTTTGSGKIVKLTFEEVQKLQLVDNEGDTTNFQIPTLEETLNWGKDKALFTLDVKRGVPFEMVVETMQEYQASSYAAVITYRIQDAQLVHSLDSTIIISVSAGDEGALNQIAKSGIPARNLLGFVGTREPESTHYEKLESMGIKTILGTLGNLDKSAEASGDDTVYQMYVENGANIIATDRPLEAAAALSQL